SDRRGLRPALLLRSSGFVSVTLSMSARKSSHRTIFLIVSSGSPLALIASSLRSTSKKPVCPMTRSLHPPMAHCRQRVRFAATWREEFFEVPSGDSVPTPASRRRDVAYPGGDRNRPAVEAQRQAEGRAAAAQERGERRGHDVVAALVEFRAQPPPAARHDQSLAEADGIGR